MYCLPAMSNLLCCPIRHAKAASRVHVAERVHCAARRGARRTILWNAGIIGILLLLSLLFMHGVDAKEPLASSTLNATRTATKDGDANRKQEAASHTHGDLLWLGRTAKRFPVNCSTWGEVEIGQELGSGGHRQVFAGTFRGEPVAVKMVKQSTTAENLHYAKHALRVELTAFDRLRHHSTPQLLGYCVQEKKRFYGMVVERLHRWRSFVRNQTVTWPQRIALTVSGFKMLRFWMMHRDERGKPDPKLLWDLKGANFGCTDDRMHLKLLDMETLVSAAQLDLNVEQNTVSTGCKRSVDCWPKRQWNEKPDDFPRLKELQCSSTGHCGLIDHRTQVAFFCWHVARPLLLNRLESDSNSDLEERRRAVSKFLKNCWKDDPSQRPGPDEAAVAVEKLGAEFMAVARTRDEDDTSDTQKARDGEQRRESRIDATDTSKEKASSSAERESNGSAAKRTATSSKLPIHTVPQLPFRGRDIVLRPTHVTFSNVTWLYQVPASRASRAKSAALHNSGGGADDDDGEASSVQPRALLVCLHSCGFSADSWFERVEMTRVVRHALARNIAVAAMAAHDQSEERCYDTRYSDANVDLRHLLLTVHNVVEAVGVNAKMPVYAFGIGRGGSLASLWARRATSPLVSAVTLLLSPGTGGYAERKKLLRAPVPTVFMYNRYADGWASGGNVRAVAEALLSTYNCSSLLFEISAQPLMPSTFRERIIGVPQAMSTAFYRLAVSTGLVDSKGFLYNHPHRSGASSLLVRRFRRQEAPLWHDYVISREEGKSSPVDEAAVIEVAGAVANNPMETRTNNTERINATAHLQRLLQDVDDVVHAIHGRGIIADFFPDALAWMIDNAYSNETI